jgi:Suppressor of fused protein (SUFU)
VARKRKEVARYVPSDRSRVIARAFANAIGSRPPIRVFEADYFPELRVAILFAAGWPAPEMNTAVTLDLGDDPVPLRSIQYEFYIVARAGWDIEQVLGDVGVRVRRHEVLPEPVEFIDGGMGPTYENLNVKHLIVLDPPIVPLPIEAPEVDPPVGFLQLVPYTDLERDVLERDDRPAIWSMLRRPGIDVLDFARD